MSERRKGNVNSKKGNRGNVEVNWEKRSRFKNGRTEWEERKIIEKVKSNLRRTERMKIIGEDYKKEDSGGRKKE